MADKQPPHAPDPKGRKTEVLFELQRHGNMLRVVAIDPTTATEVVMIADPRQNIEVIKRLAARKLYYVLEKKFGK